MANTNTDDESGCTQVAIWLIKHHEGFTRRPLPDSRFDIRIGYGTNLSIRGITPSEAELLARADVIRIVEKLKTRVHWEKLNDVRRAALVDLAYCIGIGGFLDLEHTRILLCEGKFDEAADAILASKYTNRIKTRAVDISYCIRTGELPYDVNRE